MNRIRLIQFMYIFNLFLLYIIARKLIRLLKMYEWALLILIIVLFFYFGFAGSANGLLNSSNSLPGSSNKSNFVYLRNVMDIEPVPAGNTNFYNVPYFNNLRGPSVYAGNDAMPYEPNYDMYYMQYAPPFNIDFSPPPKGLKYDFNYQPIMPVNFFDKRTYI